MGKSLMNDHKRYHMSGDEFRRFGRAMIDWIADYHENIESFSVLSKVEPGFIRSMLPETAPQNPESMEDIMNDINRIIIPGITHWQSPNFFGFFPANTSGPSMLAELLSAGLGVQGMLWTTSPACTELETSVLDWLVDMLGLPGKFKSSSQGGGVIQDSASGAALCALLVARERVTGYSINEHGFDKRLIAYCSTQTHSSIEKAVKIAGVGKQNLRVIDVDEHFAMRSDALEGQIKTDLQAGLVPFFACATIGTTSSNAIDPVERIGELCAKYGIWLHVDAAMSGSAALCPEFRYIHHGLDRADSYCFNPHKWMFTNFDCDCFYVTDRSALINTLSILPEYLRNQATESGAVFDYRDWQISLGRRFRSLKLWFVIRYYGIEGLQYHIRRHVMLARQFAQWVRNDARFELIAPAPLNLVCFRFKGDDDKNKQLLDNLNRSGKLYLTHTKLNGRFTIRFCVGQTYTEEEHVRQAWENILKEADML
jgi:aromatic-L-amino-acid decarboxylase